MKHFVIGALLLLFVLHHDFWWWESNTIVLGFLPIGLAWHALFSLLVAALWALAVRFAWPTRWERWADGEDDV